MRTEDKKRNQIKGGGDKTEKKKRKKRKDVKKT